MLIDWEFARLGDPADEIGSMFGQHELSEPQRQAFSARLRVRSELKASGRLP